MVNEPWKVASGLGGVHEVRSRSGVLIATAPTAARAESIAALPDLVRASQRAVDAVADYEAFLPTEAAKALAEMKAALARAGA